MNLGVCMVWVIFCIPCPRFCVSWHQCFRSTIIHLIIFYGYIDQCHKLFLPLGTKPCRRLHCTYRIEFPYRWELVLYESIPFYSSDWYKSTNNNTETKQPGRLVLTQRRWLETVYSLKGNLLDALVNLCPIDVLESNGL